MIIATLLALGLMCGIQAPLASSDKDLPQIKKDLPKQQEPSTLDYYLGYIDNCLTAARKKGEFDGCEFQFTDVEFDNGYSTQFLNLVVIVVKHYTEQGLDVKVKVDAGDHVILVDISLYPKDEVKS